MPVDSTSRITYIQSMNRAKGTRLGRKRSQKTGRIRYSIREYVLPTFVCSRPILESVCIDSRRYVQTFVYVPIPSYRYVQTFVRMYKPSYYIPYLRMYRPILPPRVCIDFRWYVVPASVSHTFVCTYPRPPYVRGILAYVRGRPSYNRPSTDPHRGK